MGSGRMGGMGGGGYGRGNGSGAGFEGGMGSAGMGDMTGMGQMGGMGMSQMGGMAGYGMGALFTSKLEFCSLCCCWLACVTPADGFATSIWWLLLAKTWWALTL